MADNYPEVLAGAKCQRGGKVEGGILLSRVGGGDSDGVGAGEGLRDRVATLVDSEGVGAGEFNAYLDSVEVVAVGEECRGEHDAPREGRATHLAEVRTVEGIADGVAHGVVDHIVPQGVGAVGIADGGNDSMFTRGVPCGGDAVAGGRGGCGAGEAPGNGGALGASGGIGVGLTLGYLILTFNRHCRSGKRGGGGRGDGLDHPREIQFIVNNVTPHSFHINPVAVGGARIVTSRHGIGTHSGESHPEV